VQNHELSKNIFVEEIRSVVRGILISQTHVAVLIRSNSVITSSNDQICRYKCVLLSL
jgi:hypothetical protein